jgi:hypothetical protein
LNGKIAKWKEEIKVMEKENVALMISLQKSWRSSNKRGERMNSTNKTNGEFGSLIGCFVKEENHHDKNSCCG